MPKESALRYRFSVPVEDTSVQDWLDAQIHLSVSLRLLIKEDIIRNGCTDVTCRSVEQLGKRGRPTNASLERRRQSGDESAAPPAVRQDLAHATQDVPQAEPESRQTVRQQVEPEPVQEARRPSSKKLAPVPVQAKPAVKEAVPEARQDDGGHRDDAREQSITALFSGGLAQKSRGLSAASMGLLDDDDE